MLINRTVSSNWNQREPTSASRYPMKIAHDGAEFNCYYFFLICSVPYEPTTFNLLCISKYYYFYVKTFSKVTHSDKSVEILSRKYFFQTNEKNWYFCGYFSLLNDCSLYFWRIKNVLHIITFETTIICWKIHFSINLTKKKFIKHYYETFLVCTHCELEKNVKYSD